MFNQILKGIVDGLETLEKIERHQQFEARQNGVKIRISVGKERKVSREEDFFGFDEPAVSCTGLDVMDLEYALSKMSTQFIRNKCGFDNKFAESRVKITAEGMKVKITRGNREEKFFFRAGTWGRFSLSDKFDAQRLGIPMDTMEQVEKLYK